MSFKSAWPKVLPVAVFAVALLLTASSGGGESPPPSPAVGAPARAVRAAPEPSPRAGRAVLEDVPPLPAPLSTPEPRPAQSPEPVRRARVPAAPPDVAPTATPAPRVR